MEIYHVQEIKRLGTRVVTSRSCLCSHSKFTALRFIVISARYVGSKAYRATGDETFAVDSVDRLGRKIKLVYKINKHTVI